jgi:hypothetical protein
MQPTLDLINRPVFRAVVGSTRCPDIDREEIMNACGVDDFHDGANVIRTACVVGMSKARDTFEPFIIQLGARLAHILRRMLPVSMHLLQKDGASLANSYRYNDCYNDLCKPLAYARIALPALHVLRDIFKKTALYWSPSDHSVHSE